MVAKKLATVWTSVCDAQRTWSQQSYQTLQRVGSRILRSASLDRLLSAAEEQQQPAQDEPAEDIPGLGEFKASLSRFLTTASRGEVSAACMLSDLSNMAYDVAEVNESRLQQLHGLNLVASSRAVPPPAAPAAEALSRHSLDDEVELAAAPYSPRGPSISTFTLLDEDEAFTVPGSVDIQITAEAQQQVPAQPATFGQAIAPGVRASAADPLDSAAAEEAALPPADWFVCDSTSAGASTRYFVIQGSITLDHWRINLTIDPVPFEDSSTGVKVHRGVYLAALEMYDIFVPLVKEHLAKHQDAKVVFTGHSLGGSLATVLMLLLVYRGVLPPESLSTVHTFGAPAVFCEGASHATPTGGPCSACSLPCNQKAARAAKEQAAAAAAAVHHHSGLLERLGLHEDVITNIIMTRDIVPRAFVCDYTLVADMLKYWNQSFKEHVGLAACKPHKVLYNFLGNVEVLQPHMGCGFVLPGEEHFMLPPEPALYKLTEPHCAINTHPGAVGAAGGDTSCSSKCSPISQPGSLEHELDLLALAPCSSSEPALAGVSNLGDATAVARINSMSAASVMVLPLLPGTPGLEQLSQAEGFMGAGHQKQPYHQEFFFPGAASAHAVNGPFSDLTLADAILAFMNSPHPLETLGELKAYGPMGSISRFHNPDNYTRGLASLQAMERA